MAEQAQFCIHNIKHNIKAKHHVSKVYLPTYPDSRGKGPYQKQNNNNN